MKALITEDFILQREISLDLKLLAEHVVRRVRAKVQSVHSIQISTHIYKVMGRTRKEAILDEIEFPRSGNEVLDSYYLEGMKLFNQGPYAKNIKPRDNDSL